MAKTEAEQKALKAIFGEGYSEEAPPSASGTPTETPQPTEGNQEPPVIEGKETPPPAQTEPPVVVAKVEEPKELSDEELIALIQKRKGISIKSFDDLMPKVDPAEEAEKRETEKINFAFQKGLISKREYDSFVSDSRDPKSLPFEDFAKDAKESDPELTDEQIAEEFAEEFALNADPESAKYKRGQKRLQVMSDKLMRDKHSKVFGIDSEFSKHEQEAKGKSELNQKILSTTPQFKKDVEDVILEKSKVKVSFSEGEEYEVQIPDTSWEDIRNEFLNEDFIKSQIQKGYSKDEISAAIEMASLKKNFQTIVKSMAAKYLETHSKGTAGIPPTGSLKEETKRKTLTDQETAWAKAHGLLN